MTFSGSTATHLQGLAGDGGEGGVMPALLEHSSSCLRDGATVYEKLLQPAADEVQSQVLQIVA